MSERHVHFDMIVQAVSAVSGVSARAMMADRRDGAFNHSRFAVWWLASEMTALSLTTIGRLSGDRDHTTIINGLRRAGELRASDNTFRCNTDAILGALRAIEASGLVRLSRSIDPLETARRVLASPEREAVRVSTHEIVALCHAVVDAADPTPFETEETEHAA